MALDTVRRKPIGYFIRGGGKLSDSLGRRSLRPAMEEEDDMAPPEPDLSTTLKRLSVRPMSRREFVSQGAKLTLSATAVGSLLAACESSTANTNKSVTLRLVTFEGVQKPNIQHAAALFSKQHPNVKIVTEFVPFTSTRDKMAIELASGKGGLDFLF